MEVRSLSIDSLPGLGNHVIYHQCSMSNVMKTNLRWVLSKTSKSSVAVSDGNEIISARSLAKLIATVNMAFRKYFLPYAHSIRFQPSQFDRTCSTRTLPQRQAPAGPDRYRLSQHAPTVSVDPFSRLSEHVFLL